MASPTGDARAVVLAVGASEDLDALCVHAPSRGINAFGPVAPEAADLRTIASGLKAECAVVDLRGMHDLPRDLLRTLCQRLAPLTLVITDLADVDGRLAALRYGAADTVVAPFERRELVERVEIAVTRRRRTRHGRVSLGDVTFEPAARILSRHGVTVSLTAREVQIFEALLRANGRPVTKQELLHEVWNGEPRTLNSVEAHISALRRKLEQLDARLIHTVHGRGYAFRASAERSTAQDSLLTARQRLFAERDAAGSFRSSSGH
jgi:DNA-binding response OmpR family regulator